MRRLVKLFLFLGSLALTVVVVVRLVQREPAIPTESYLVLDISGEYTEAPPQDLVGRLLSRSGRTLIDLLSTIRMAKVDPRIKGMVVRIGSMATGWGKLLDIRDGLADFKRSGKPLLGLLEQEVSASNAAYYLASACDRIYLPPSATAPLAGLAAHFIFLGGVWEKLDVDMTVEKIAEYKTFGDMISNKQMTEAHREMANSLLDSLNDHFVGTIAQARRIETEVVRTLIDQCPTTVEELVRHRLADGAKYLEDLHDELGGPESPFVSLKDYQQVRPESLDLNVGPQIAVVFGVGAIVSGDSHSTLQGEMLGARTVADALLEASEDEDIRAILFRVDSPGGSALASDLVWRATQAAKQKKPVIVSMSDVAGSGGYYVSAGATRIVAQPTTFTGSIGVVMARPEVDRLLNRMGITTATLTRGRFAALDDLTTELSPEGRQKIVAEMRHVYDVFVSRVAAGRNLTTEQVDQVGRGRVWTGTQAKQNGLIDELGGFHVALQAAKQAAGIDAEQEVKFVFYPRKKNVVERVAEMLETRAGANIPPALRTALSHFAFPFESGSVLTLMPQSIAIR